MSYRSLRIPNVYSYLLGLRKSTLLYTSHLDYIELGHHHLLPPLTPLKKVIHLTPPKGSAYLNTSLNKQLKQDFFHLTELKTSSSSFWSFSLSI